MHNNEVISFDGVEAGSIGIDPKDKPSCSTPANLSHQNTSTPPCYDDCSPASPTFSSVSDLSIDMVRIFGQDNEANTSSTSESICSESVSSSADSQSEIDRLDAGISRGFTTFKIIGDNLDKNVKPRDMRIDFQTRSLHYFHACAVQDRIDLLVVKLEFQMSNQYNCATYCLEILI